MGRLLDTRQPRALLVVLCLLLWLPGFWTLPPSDRDESRFAQASKQMLETGDYVRIRNGTEDRNRKPIGIYWLQVSFAEAAQLAGVATENPIWPYRLPSLLGALLAVLATHAAGTGLVGRRAALLGAAMLAACVLLVGEVHIAKTDAALLGATSVAMAILAHAYLDPAAVGPCRAAAFWLALGAGVLLKGPITPMVAGLAVLTLFIADRRGAWLRCLQWRRGVPLMLLVILPWFVAIGLATHGRFFTDAVGGDLARKLAGGEEQHWGPPGLHLLLLPLLLFPSAAALPAGFVAGWRERRSIPVRFLLAWIVPAWLVFEAAPTKLPHYPLPLYPALCLLMAHGIVIGWRSRWLGPILGGFGAVVLAITAIAAPIFLGVGWWLGLPGLVGAAIVGLFAVRGPALAATIAAPLAYAPILGWEATRLTPLWIAPRVQAILPPGHLGSVGYSEPSLMFLAGTGTTWLTAPEAAQALADGAVTTLLVGDRDLPAVQADLAKRNVPVRTLATVPGYNYSRGRRVVLTVLQRAG